MDFFDELTQAVIRDGARRGVRSSAGEFQKFLADTPHDMPAADSMVPEETTSYTPPAPVLNVEPAATAENVPLPEPSTREVQLPEDWNSLRSMVLSCSNCPLAKTRANAVFGEGDLRARLMFIGEAPGAEEDASGRPFVGAAGQLLDKMISAMHLAREDVYIANIVKCRPPGNRMPGEEEAAACIGYLKKQIELINPEVIVLLGGTALHFLLKLDGITHYRGRWHSCDGIAVMPTFHPAFLLRKPEAKREAWNDLKQVMAKLGIAV